MALDSGLETIPIGVQGWNDMLTRNIELLDEKLEHLMTAASVPGTDTVSDNSESAVQTSTLVSPATVSGSGADATINDNFSDLAGEINNLVADVGDVKALAESIQTTLNAILAALRKSSGCGVLGG